MRIALFFVLVVRITNSVPVDAKSALKGEKIAEKSRKNYVSRDEDYEQHLDKFLGNYYSRHVEQKNRIFAEKIDSGNDSMEGMQSDQPVQEDGQNPAGVANETLTEFEYRQAMRNRY